MLFSYFYISFSIKYILFLILLIFFLFNYICFFIYFYIDKFSHSIHFRQIKLFQMIKLRKIQIFKEISLNFLSKMECHRPTHPLLILLIICGILYFALGLIPLIQLIRFSIYRVPFNTKVLLHILILCLSIGKFLRIFFEFSIFDLLFW